MPVFLILMYFDRNMQNMQNDMQNMQNMQKYANLISICKICTPHFAADENDASNAK